MYRWALSFFLCCRTLSLLFVFVLFQGSLFDYALQHLLYLPVCVSIILWAAAAGVCLRVCVHALTFLGRLAASEMSSITRTFFFFFVFRNFFILFFLFLEGAFEFRAAASPLSRSFSPYVSELIKIEWLMVPSPSTSFSFFLFKPLCGVTPPLLFLPVLLLLLLPPPPPPLEERT